MLCLIPYSDDDDAIRIANDSEYGLAGTVWTADHARGLNIAKRIETGSVGINKYRVDPASPYCGTKASGLGLELGPEALGGYERFQSVYL